MDLGRFATTSLDVLEEQVRATRFCFATINGSCLIFLCRDFDPTNGGLGWDQQFAFRGHIVALIDEKTSSDGEGVARGISELGLGRLIGTRTWGGGIWLASDNDLVDGGIATVRSQTC